MSTIIAYLLVIVILGLLFLAALFLAEDLFGG